MLVWLAHKPKKATQAKANEIKGREKKSKTALNAERRRRDIWLKQKNKKQTWGDISI